MKKYIAEFIGTFTLVFFGTGVAVVTNNIVATALAFGLAIIASAYVIGNISGCHVNPAVSLAVLITGKMNVKDFFCYVVAQVLGAFAATALLGFVINETSLVSMTLGANGFNELSATGISIVGAALVEVVLTFIFVYTILGVTNDESKSNIAGLVIGLTLAFVHLLGINLTSTSVNPARSLSPAVFAGGEALCQVWVFILFPLLGATLAAFVFKYLNESKPTARKRVVLKKRGRK